MDIIVTGNELEFGGKKYKCAIGKSGFSPDKKEGDNCTPIGVFPLRGVFYRADKTGKPATKLHVTETLPDDGWCDAADDENYNKKVKLPYPASHEKLWRDDGLYDLVVMIGYNDEPPEAGKGSAIFMHVARPEYQGTEGCVALEIGDLKELLAQITPETRIIIRPA